MKTVQETLFHALLTFSKLILVDLLFSNWLKISCHHDESLLTCRIDIKYGINTEISSRSKCFSLLSYYFVMDLSIRVFLTVAQYKRECILRSRKSHTGTQGYLKVSLFRNIIPELTLKISFHFRSKHLALHKHFYSRYEEGD